MLVADKVNSLNYRVNTKYGIIKFKSRPSDYYYSFILKLNLILVFNLGIPFSCLVIIKEAKALHKLTRYLI